MEIKHNNGFKNVGGTSGGIGEFLIGLGMAIAGAYMIMSRVIVSSGFWTVYGYNTFGLTLIPLVIGIGLIFFNGRSIVGWLLVFASVIIIFSAIIMNLQIYFQPTNLYVTIIMLILLAGGIGLIARAIRAH